MPTWHIARSLEKESYKIITSQNYGSPFIEYTLMYSTVWASHRKREEYALVLRNLYPRSFIYSTWDNTFKHWGDQFDIMQIAASGKKVYLYLERDEEDLYNKTMAKIREVNDVSFAVSRSLIYRNKATNEVIFELQFVPEGDRRSDLPEGSSAG